MRLLKITLAIFSLLALAGACSKGSSGPSSAEGKWTYTTPDTKIKVDFELIKTSGGSLDVQNQSLTINGTVANSEKQISGVSLPIIGSIRINANDSKVNYPFHILFTNGKVSSDFKRIDMPDGDYTPFPWDNTTIPLKTISIVRP